MKRALLGIALAIAFLGSAVPASAQVYRVVTYPVVVAAGPFVGPEQLRGTVTSFDRFNMTVRADGDYFPVQLHQGTIINPTGLTLAPGMFIRVLGFWSNGAFQANRIVLIR